MPFAVVYDACVLHPAPLRDLLLRVARAGIVQARWSPTILDECFSSIARERPDLDPRRLERTRALMEPALPAVMVHDYESLALARHDIDAKHPDDLVLDCLDLAPAVVANCVREQASALRNPERTKKGDAPLTPLPPPATRLRA